MPTFVDTPQKGVNKPQFPRKPQPGVNIHPDSRLAQQKPEGFQGPHPFLLAHGFNGDINSFNNRVQKAHDGYAQAYGQEPSPGLVWDVALNPRVEDTQIQDLFKVPLSQRDTKAQKFHLEAQHNGNALYVRDDKQVQPTNLLTAYRQKMQGFNAPDVTPAPKSAHVLSSMEFHKRYPMLADGFTGFLPFGSKFWQDVSTSSGNPARFKQELGYLSPGQALKVANQAQDYQLSQEAQGAAMLNQATQSNVGSKEVKGAIAGSFQKEHGEAVDRNKIRQQWLLKHDPSDLFAGLSANGVFDRQWMTAYDQWSRTPGAAYIAMQSVAKQNYFEPTASGIKAMSEAAQLKQKMANSTKKWSEKWQIEATPLRFFADHSAVMGKTMLDPKNDEQLLKDFWKYEDTGTSALWPIAALQGGFRFAKLGFNTLSGGFNQLTGDANGFTTVLGKDIIPGINNGKSTKQIANDFATAVKENPDWVRVLGFGYLPKHLTGSPAFLDGVGNFVISSAIAMMMSGPGYWKIGEDTPLGALRENLGTKMLTRLAHSDIKANDLVRAAGVLGPRDSDTFIAAVYKDIQDGKLGHEDFHDLVTKYYKEGHVKYEDQEFGNHANEGILPQLHSDKLPKSRTKLTLQQLQPKYREAMNNLETQALAHGNSFGKISEAFVRQTRGMFGLASPDNKLVDLFGTQTPNQIESYLVNHSLATSSEAQELANKYILARAHENIPEMEGILKDANARYRAKFPKGRSFGETSDFEKLLETENLTHFRFAGGGLREGSNVWQKSQNVLAHINNAFNTVGHYWRRTILATGPGLFYKHLTRDSLAALMGGMKLGTPTEDMLNAYKTFEQVARENPEVRRLHAATRGSVSGADLSYMLGHNYSATGAFKLMDEIANNSKAAGELSLKAATHLRRMVMSKMYGPFREALATGNMEPMTQVVMEDKNFRALLHENTDISKQLESIRSYGAREIGQTRDYSIKESEVVALRTMMERQLVKKEASAYAKAVFDEYKAVVDEGKAQHIPDILDTVDGAHWANPGMADKKVASLLRENEVNIEVKGGAPQPKDWFDKSTGAAVSTFMKPNKFFRNKLFDHAFMRNYANMLGMGYDPTASAGMAVRLTEHQTMYHMLDFSNTLQFEQKFRGFLPFFTKHRLFVKWVAARVAQYPGIVMPASEISKHLDQYGRLNFTFMGTPLNLNVTRLMWLNSEDMPAIIPGAQLIPKAGLPGEFTRFDSVIGAWFHGVQSHWSYKAVTAHMDQYSVERLDRYMAIYAINYRMAHGQSAPVPESEALKYAMIRANGGGITRDLIFNNSFLTPVTFSEPQTPGPIGKVDQQFSKLFNENPAKARAFLDKHPEAGLGWGMTENFDLYNHVTQYWGLYDKLHSEYMKVEKHFSDQVLAGKQMSAEDYVKMHAAQDRYDQGIQHLLVQDARQWKESAGGYPAGQVDGSGFVSSYGPWGTLFLHDPIGSANRLIQQFGGRKAFSTQDLHKIYGEYSQMIQYNIDHAKQLGLDAASVSDLYSKLQSVQGTYKVTEAPTLYESYKTARNAYENKLIGLYNKAKNQYGYAKSETLYEARTMILDNYEHPTIKYDGKEVKVLPFAEYGLATKTPQEQSLEIWKNMVGYSYSELTYDQKQRLGIKTTPQVDEGWGVFDSWVADYEQRTGKEASTSVREELAAATNKQYPGFWRDYKIAHLPKAFVLLYYAKGAFNGQYGGLWKQLVTRAAQTYNSNKAAWGSQVPALNEWIRENWPKGFVREYQAAGGAEFLQGLIEAWG